MADNPLGVCMVDCRGAYVAGGMHRGGRAWQILRDTVNERGGTHPTGMHSCCD